MHGTQTNGSQSRPAFYFNKRKFNTMEKNKLQIICNYSNTTSFFFQCHSCPHNFQHETNHHICHKQPSLPFSEFSSNRKLESLCRRLSTDWKDINAFLFKTAQRCLLILNWSKVHKEGSIPKAALIMYAMVKIPQSAFPCCLLTSASLITDLCEPVEREVLLYYH